MSVFPRCVAVSCPTQWSCLALVALLAVGCGNTVTSADGDVVDLDGINLNDIDLDGVDVDQDTLGKLDTKSDTLGADAKDTEGTDAAGSDTTSPDTADIAAGCTSTAACDDKNPCTSDSCELGVCKNVANSLECNDNNACTSNDLCASGTCAGTPINCDDGNICTTDSCNKTAGCVNLANAATCDDGIACTLADTCTATLCVGVPNDATCSDGNACTDDSCDVASGKCVNTNNTAECTDKNACTTGDVCTDGACIGTAEDCNDDNVCTTDSCETNSGDCAHVANTLACNDGNACTLVDTCVETACTGTGAPNCDDQNACTADSCTAATGCVHEKLGDTACSDGNACTIGDFCTDGVCMAGEPTTCNDGNLCTDDSCNPDTGACVNLANTATCDDGDPCTLGDACTQTVCEGVPNTCGQLPDAATSTCSALICDYTDGICKLSTSGAVWGGTFATQAGWKLQGEWQVGMAAASTDQTFGNPDPSGDADGDKYLAGTVIGGNISNSPHDWYYLTSPVVDLSSYATSAYLDYTTEWAYDHSLVFEFNWFANMSGVAGQYMTLEFSGDGKTWVSAVTRTDDVASEGWSYANQFFQQSEFVPKSVLTKHFQFRFGYKIVDVGGIVPVVSGMSLDAPQIMIGNCWD